MVASFNVVYRISVSVSPRLMGATEAHVEVDPEGVVELVDGPTISMTDHPRRQDLLIGRIRLTPLIEDEETFLTVRLVS